MDDSPAVGVAALLANLPSSSRRFSQLKQPTEWSRVSVPVTYYPTHEHTQPPPDQVVATEKTNILLRQFQQLAKAKRERQKRSASEQPPACRSKSAKLAGADWST
uniref:DET1- and DDB1-associated protein 1 domain-containing protein n=1 Tax=Coccolithus braarudii TaxID=221442 RepID=A0A7S0Q2S0_9EUKA|mmetsp:Transcript_36187/g.77173  ORF Transcript_36187/g.77173 Transcript_36187/m.77173 type:complete len:105 (+) Transcript_36187:16-330(+)